MVVLNAKFRLSLEMGKKRIIILPVKNKNNKNWKAWWR